MIGMRRADVLVGAMLLLLLLLVLVVVEIVRLPRKESQT